MLGHSEDTKCLWESPPQEGDCQGIQAQAHQLGGDGVTLSAARCGAKLWLLAFGFWLLALGFGCPRYCRLLSALLHSCTPSLLIKKHHHEKRQLDLHP